MSQERLLERRLDVDGTTIKIQSKITPFLWFDKQAEEAARFYVSTFRNSRPGEVARYGDAGPGPNGSVMTVTFQIEGQEFVALNGGPMFQFSPAISFVVNCECQEEVDYYWEALSAGGRKQQCGWVQDRYGVSWQVVPRLLQELVAARDAEAAQRVMRAMLGMEKLEIQKLKRAYENGSNGEATDH